MKLNNAILMLCLIVAACSDSGMTDKQEPVSLFVQDLVIVEGEDTKPVFLNLQLSAASEQRVVVNVRTQDGTAVAGEDFVEIPNQQVTFSAGTFTQALKVDIIGDDIAEADEAFTIELSNPSGAVLTSSSITITIENDDIDTEFAIPQAGYETPQTYPGMTLIWQDEFDGKELNEDFWTYEIGNGSGWGNNELQYYREENAFIKEGHLVIEARKESFAGFNYTSSRLITENNFDFQYGRVDIRAALPEGQGLWPALWMLGSSIRQVGWPACGEIDIMELIGGGPGRDDTVHGTIHWSQSGSHAYTGDGTTIPSSDSFKDVFHVFSIRWDDSQIRWYLDDELFYSVDVTADELSEFHENFFFIFNVAVGGNWPGSPDATTVFPQRMIVDYIRVFQ